MAPPNFPTDFMSKEAKQVNEAPSTVPDKLTFNFYLPHEQIAKAKKVFICCLYLQDGVACGCGHLYKCLQKQTDLLLHLTLHAMQRYFVPAG